jgi:hypothetical protein
MAEAKDSGLKVGLLLAPVGLSALLQAAHFVRSRLESARFEIRS